jgi:hypothetical protein
MKYLWLEIGSLLVMILMIVAIIQPMIITTTRIEAGNTVNTTYFMFGKPK